MKKTRMAGSFALRTSRFLPALFLLFILGHFAFAEVYVKPETTSYPTHGVPSVQYPKLEVLYVLPQESALSHCPEFPCTLSHGVEYDVHLAEEFQGMYADARECRKDTAKRYDELFQIAVNSWDDLQDWRTSYGVARRTCDVALPWSSPRRTWLLMVFESWREQRLKRAYAGNTATKVFYTGPAFE